MLEAGFGEKRAFHTGINRENQRSNVTCINTDGDRNLTSHDYGVDIPVVAEVVGASETGEQIQNQPPDPPVEVFTTIESSVSEFYMAEKLTKDGTIYYVGVEKIYLKGGRGGSEAGDSDKLGISTGVPDLRFCLLFA